MPRGDFSRRLLAAVSSQPGLGQVYHELFNQVSLQHIPTHFNIPQHSVTQRNTRQESARDSIGEVCEATQGNRQHWRGL